MSFARQKFEKGITKGRAEGMAEGRAEEVLEGRAEGEQLGRMKTVEPAHLY